MTEFIDADVILDRMRHQTINYDKVLRKMIVKWQEQDQRPRILMHSCCAPCSTSSLEFLAEFADVTIFFSNSNIHPRCEYLRRAHEQKIFIDKFNAQTGHSVGFIEDVYDPTSYNRMVRTHNLMEAKEGGERCTACFNMRLDRSAEIAQELGYDYFGSVITLSPKKNSALINELGIDVQKIYDVKYLPSDFKKNNGYKRSIDMCHEYDVYRQCYCGCVYAAKQQGVDMKVVNQAALEYLKDKEETWEKISFRFVKTQPEKEEQE